VDSDYGHAYDQSLPNARFELIQEVGHTPQFDPPERLLTLVREFVDTPVAGLFEDR
jgi:pimeloyl-ACP methyl ester carboxylesterase